MSPLLPILSGCCVGVVILPITLMFANWLFDNFGKAVLSGLILLGFEFGFCLAIHELFFAGVGVGIFLFIFIFAWNELT